MREYKFKAFYKPLKIMLQPEQIESINLETKVLGVYMEMDGRGYHKLRMSDFELLQYTGLNATDDETELYRGDIIEYVTFNYDGTDNGIKRGFIEWWNEVGAYMVYSSQQSQEDDEEEWLYLILANDDGVKKIGNIHDPELLEG